MLVHGCAPFDCFWKGRAALAITVVVQPFGINGGVRSFFLLKTAVNAGVQETQISNYPFFCWVLDLSICFKTLYIFWVGVISWTVDVAHTHTIIFMISVVIL